MFLPTSMVGAQTQGGHFSDAPLTRLGTSSLQAFEMQIVLRSTYYVDLHFGDTSDSAKVGWILWICLLFWLIGVFFRGANSFIVASGGASSP